MTISVFDRVSCHACVALILLSASVMGCSGDSTQSRTLTIMQSSVSLGDPHICSDSMNRLNLVFSVYDALVQRDSEGHYQPSLAESWTVGEDTRTWTFALRKDVRFHNGDILTSGDVVATMGRVLDPSIGGSFGTQGVYLSYLEHAEFLAIDDLTVQIVTEFPMADLLDLLVAMPISPESELHRLPDQYVGTGRYRVKELTESRTILEANDAYWGIAPEYQELHWIAEPSSEKRTDALLSGDADVVTRISVRDKERIEKDGGAQAFELESGLCIIFMCNALDGVGTDRRVRQALNYALDVEEIIDEIKDGAATPLNGFLTPHHFGYNPATPAYPYDPEKARALLADAGYADGMHLVLDIPSTMPNEAPALAEMMAEQYSRVGISVEVVVHEDRAAYSEMVREKKINDACCFDSSPRSTYRVLREKLMSTLEGPWWEGYENLQVNALIEKAERTFVESEREEIYRQIYDLIRDDAPWIFLYRPTDSWGISSTVTGWQPRSDGLLRF